LEPLPLDLDLDLEEEKPDERFEVRADTVPADLLLDQDEGEKADGEDGADDDEDDFDYDDAQI
jgi:hypothetical protein